MTLPSTLDLIKQKLRGLLGRVEAKGYVDNDKDVQIVSELVDDIRDATTDYQVSDGFQLLIRALIRAIVICLDGTPTGHIRPEPQTDCELPKRMRVNVSNS